jgi:DNA-directed RNA polymerase specialized sigma24 family protein
MRRGSNTLNSPPHTMHIGEDHAPGRHTTSDNSAALYRRHYHTLCTFARARGCECHDAEDAVQELFAKLLAQGQVERAADICDHGEQAAVLIARLRTHLIKRWHFRTRQRRGGGIACYSLHDAEGQSIDVPDEHASPDGELDRDWARSVLEQALQRMNRELCAEGRSDVWQTLESDLVENKPNDQPRNGALRIALFRARQRLRGFIRDQIGSSSEDAARMLHHAFA